MNAWIRKIMTVFSAAVVAAAAIPVGAQAAGKRLPSGVAFDEIGDEIGSFAAEHKYASFEAAVFCGDETLYTGYFGEIDCESHIAADEESVYDWGSITKTLTWVSALQLYEQGKLDLNEDVRNYLPDGFIRHEKYDEPITMLNLMNHNAGWCESTYDIFEYGEYVVDDLGTLLQSIEPAQTYRPGERTAYSNYGAGLAGYVVECVSGESYVDYVRNHIFKPLGMEQTSIAPDFIDNSFVHAQRMKLKSYIVNMEGDPVLGGTSWAVIKPYPAGSACGTISDLVKFGQALVDESAPLFDDPATQAMIWKGSAFHADTDIPSCCYGFWTEQHKTMTYCHDGGTLTCISNFVFDPVSDVGVVIFSNTTSAADIIMGIPDLVFGKAEPEDFPASEITDHKDISGPYMASRTYKKGIMKFMGDLSVANMIAMGEDSFDFGGMAEMTRIGNDLYIWHDTYRDTNMLVSGKTLSDGSYAIDVLSEDYVQESAGIAKTVFVVVYLLFMVISLFWLLVKLILTIIRKRRRYTGSGFITLAQVGKLLALIAAAAMFMTLRGGVMKPVGIAFACVNILCAIFCVLAVVSDVRSIRADAFVKAKTWQYVFNIVVNGIFLFVLVSLETYQFWGC